MGLQSVKRKSFRYETSTEWIGRRRGRINTPGKPEVVVASPPEFRGEEGYWTPEHLFVAAVETCTMTTFISLAERRGIVFDRYSSEAEGLLEFDGTGLRFTKIVIRVEVIVPEQQDTEAVLAVLDETHDSCLIGRSMLTEVVLQPQVMVASGATA
jgi:organic hydroperoxide reductase OsmC/OhrA